MCVRVRVCVCVCACACMVQVKLLSKETEFQTQAQQEAAEALQASQDLYGQTQAELQRTQLEHAETTALRDNRSVRLSVCRSACLSIRLSVCGFTTRAVNNNNEFYF